MSLRKVALRALIGRDNMKALYEAGKQHTSKRTFIPGCTQDARDDLSCAERTTLMHKSRFFVNNSPTMRGVVRRLVNFTIGSGLVPVPASSDKGYNQEAIEAWKEWALSPDLTSNKTFYMLQRAFMFQALLDGDLGVLLTYEGAIPKLQVIESHRIGVRGNPDGVITDSYGRPIAYQINDNGDIETIDADDLVLWDLPERVGLVRGEPYFAATLNWLHDVDDILNAERESIKALSNRIDVIETETGEFDDEDIDVFDEDPNDTSDLTPAKRDTPEKVIFGTETITLRKGETWKPWESSRPSTAFQGFIDYLSSAIALSTAASPSVLLGQRIGGADTRRELATTERAIEALQMPNLAHTSRVYTYVMPKILKTRKLPKDWRKVNFQRPRKLTADAGRERKADKDDVLSGLMTLDTFFGQQGHDWRDKLRQLSEEKEVLNEMGLTIGDAFANDSTEQESTEDKPPQT